MKYSPAGRCRLVELQLGRCIAHVYLRGKKGSNGHYFTVCAFAGSPLYTLVILAESSEPCQIGGLGRTQRRIVGAEEKGAVQFVALDTQLAVLV